MQTLLDAKAQLDHQDDLGLTPLMISSQSNCSPVVMCLLRAGAALDTVDKNDHTALWHAESNGHRAIAFLSSFLWSSSCGRGASHPVDLRAVCL